MAVKKFGLIVLTSLLLSGCSLLPEKAGVELLSYPTAKVFIDNKEAGITPYRNNNLKPGKISVKLQAEGMEWKGEIKLINGTNTVVERDLNKNNNDSGGYVLNLEKNGDNKKSGLIVVSNPDRASVSIDGEMKGMTPLMIDDIGEGDKQIIISFPMYKKITVFGKGIPGYQSVITADLVKETEVEEVEKVVEKPIINKIKIKQTETGWLRVRSTPDSNGSEIGRVKPGEEYQILETRDEWYKITLDGEKIGWVSAKYVDNISE
ncbi:MAG TPA: PEGA domain-containing protein [Candidatus Woesebacteria bacterium]|nr:PEGA domain-containing protein [Candidatus Woesebacteria bacterium]